MTTKTDLKAQSSTVEAVDARGASGKQVKLAEAMLEARRLNKQLQREVAERKLVEQALRESEYNLAKAQEIAHIGSWTWDLLTEEVSWSVEMYRIFGLEPDGFDGGIEAMINTMVHPEDRDKVRAFTKAVLFETAPKSIEYRVIRPDGQERVVRAERDIVLDATGKDIRMIGTVQDITERKRVDEELQRYRDHLEETVAERAAELLRTNARLKWEVTERKRVEDAVRQRNRELAALSKTGQMITSTLTLDRVLATVLDEVRRLLSVVACSIWLVDKNAEALVCKQATGPKSDVVCGWRLSLGVGVVGYVASTGKSLIVPDVDNDGRHFKGVDQETQLPVRSLLTVPLRVKANIIGVLQVVDAEVGRFGASDLALLESLAAYAAIAIENAQLYERARALQAFNENIVQSMEEGIVIENVAGRITFANPKAAEMLGYDAPHPLIDRHWKDIIAPECLEALEERAIPHYLNNEKSSGVAERYETVLLTQQGDRIPVIMSARPLFEDQAFTGELAVFTDITERVQAEEALRQSETRYRTVSELTSDFAYAFRVEPGYRFICDWMTEAFTRITGFAFEAINVSNGWLEVVHPDDQSAIRQVIRRRVLAGEPSMSELRIVTKSGEVRWLRNHTRPVWDAAQERVTHFYGAAQDITERKRAEQQAIRAEQLAALGQLAAALAHEINNPLQALRSGLRLLINHTLAEEKRQLYLEVTAREVERLITITERMLNFYRPGMEQQELAHIPDIVEEILALANKKLQHGHVSVQQDGARDLPPVQAMVGQLKQVFLNIILNALDAMPEGGDLIVKTGWEEPNAKINGWGELWIAFTDTGVGMSEQEIAHIFSPFYTTKPNGTGLGLAISYDIIERHGGRIEVRSQVGKGSTFTVFLPAWKH